MKPITIADIDFVCEHFGRDLRCVAPKGDIRDRVCLLVYTGSIRVRYEETEVFYASGVFAKALTSRDLSKTVGSPIVAL